MTNFVFGATRQLCWAVEDRGIKERTSPVLSE